MLYDVARSFFRAFGLVPASEVADFAQFDADMTALGVPPSERAGVLEAAVTFAKAGFTPDDIAAAARAFARGDHLR